MWEIMFEKPISINYIKKAPYFGSSEGVSFAFIKNEDKLEAYLYPGPFGFDKTPEELKSKKVFEFSESGYQEAVSWMNDHIGDYEKVAHGRRFDINSIEKICKS